MIKELKVNLFRAFRMKSFYIILGVLLAFTIICAFLIFFLTGDMLGIVSSISPQIGEQADKYIDHMVSEAEASMSIQNEVLSQAGFSPEEIQKINFIMGVDLSAYKSNSMIIEENEAESRILEGDYTIIYSDPEVIGFEIDGSEYYCFATDLTDPTFASEPTHEGGDEWYDSLLEPPEPNEYVYDEGQEPSEYTHTTEPAQEKSVFELLGISMEDYSSMISPWGAQSMMWSGGLSAFLICIFVALFVGAEYKSRFHINHYSANTSCRMILFCEWLSINLIILIIQTIVNLSTIGFTYLFCSDFHVGDLKDFFIRTLLLYLCNVVFASFSFMIAVLRRGSAMAIALSSLLCFEVVHLFVEIISVWNSTLRKLSINWLYESLFSQDYFSMNSYLAMGGIILIYLLVFVGTTLTVSSYRDAY